MLSTEQISFLVLFEAFLRRRGKERHPPLYGDVKKEIRSQEMVHSKSQGVSGGQISSERLMGVLVFQKKQLLF